MTEFKEQAKGWEEPGGSPPKLTKIQKSAGKVMDSVFWIPVGIVHRLFEKKKYNQQRLILCIIGPIERRNPKKTTSFIASFWKTVH